MITKPDEKEKFENTLEIESDLVSEKFFYNHQNDLTKKELAIFTYGFESEQYSKLIQKKLKAKILTIEKIINKWENHDFISKS